MTPLTPDSAAYGFPLSGSRSDRRASASRAVPLPAFLPLLCVECLSAGLDDAEVKAASALATFPPAELLKGREQSVTRGETRKRKGVDTTARRGGAHFYNSLSPAKLVCLRNHPASALFLFIHWKDSRGLNYHHVPTALSGADAVWLHLNLTAFPCSSPSQAPSHSRADQPGAAGLGLEGLLYLLRLTPSRRNLHLARPGADVGPELPCFTHSRKGRKGSPQGSSPAPGGTAEPPQLR